MAAELTTRLLTAEQFLAADLGEGTFELVHGEVVRMSPPSPEHGLICGNIAGLLWDYGRRSGLGYMLSNDSAVLTERSPDTVRGPDVCFYSHARWPRSQVTRSLPPVAPDLVVEVSDNHPNRLSRARLLPLREKVAEGRMRGGPDRNSSSASALEYPSSAAARHLLPQGEKGIGEYLDAGTLMVWIVCLRSRTVAVYRSFDAPPVVLQMDQTIEELPELPGFRCLVSDVFL